MKRCKKCGSSDVRFYSNRHLTCISCMKVVRPVWSRVTYDVMLREQKRNVIRILSNESHRKVIESQFKVGMSWSNYGAWEFRYRLPLNESMTLGQLRERLKIGNVRPVWVDVSGDNEDIINKRYEEYHNQHNK